jgi:MFS family permease
LEILRHAAALNGLEKDEVFPSNTKLLQDEDEKDASLADLFTPKWRETTLRLWGAWGSFAFGYYGTLLAITKVFAEAETINRVAVGDEEPYSFDYGAIFASSTAELVGTTMVIFAVDRIGRIPSQVFSYLIAGLSVCALCVFASWGFPRYALIGLSFIARVFEMAATCVTWVSTAEILTTEVRSTGHSTANAMARLGAIFCPYLVQGSASLTQIGIVMLLVHFFTAFCVSKLPETKGKGMGTVSEDQPVDSAINRLNLLPLETNDYNEDNLVIQGELS